MDILVGENEREWDRLVVEEETAGVKKGGKKDHNQKAE